MRNKYLEILELQPGATKKEIKSAFRRLSKKYHPDVNPHENAEATFIEISEAYNFLTSEGPSFDSQQSTYSNEPFVSEYDLWKEAMRVRAQQLAEERKRRELEFIANVTRAFDVVVLISIVFNMLLLLDYFLPKKEYSQTIDVAVISNIYTNAEVQAYVDVGYNFDHISFEDFDITYQKEILPYFNHYENASVMATIIFKKPTSIIIMRNGIIREYPKPYNIYRFFKVIPFTLVLLFLYRFLKRDHHRLGLAIILFIFLLYELVMFLVF